MDIIEKMEKLRDLLRTYKHPAIAFSGGVDSTFLLLIAQETLGDAVTAITVRAASFPRKEMEEAEQFCKDYKIKQLFVDINVEEVDGFLENPVDRCYLCKKAIFTHIWHTARESGSTVLADGTNADDGLDYRPGLKALRELQVVSPLKEAGLTKEEIRLILKKKGMPIWEKPAYACLATRIPHGEPITEKKLRQIEFLEEKLRERGFLQVRVRHHGTVARIEVLSEDRSKFIDESLMDEVYEWAEKAGFQFASLDLKGYRMGSMNVKEINKEIKA